MNAFSYICVADKCDLRLGSYFKQEATKESSRTLQIRNVRLSPFLVLLSITPKFKLFAQ